MTRSFTVFLPPVMSESQRKLDNERCDTGCQFFPLYDAFHLPCPSLNTDLVSQSSARVGFVSNDRISNLPPKVMDLILAFLSPVTLDAARLTCKTWRSKIMSNTWLLASVLGRSSSDGFLWGPISDIESRSTDQVSKQQIYLRYLLNRLDQDTDLISTHQQSDSWRTRFRIRELNFLASDDLDLRCSKRLITAVSCTGSQRGFLVLQVTAIGEPDSAPDSSICNLAFYNFDTNEYARYVGRGSQPGESGILNVL